MFLNFRDTAADIGANVLQSFSLLVGSPLIVNNIFLHLFIGLLFPPQFSLSLLLGLQFEIDLGNSLSLFGNYLFLFALIVAFLGIYSSQLLFPGLQIRNSLFVEFDL